MTGPQLADILYKQFSYFGADSWTQKFLAYDSISEREVIPENPQANCFCILGMHEKLKKLQIIPNNIDAWGDLNELAINEKSTVVVTLNDHIFKSYEDVLEFLDWARQQTILHRGG